MSSSLPDVVDDQDPRVVYAPASSWKFTVHYGDYNPANGSIHWTLSPNSAASLNFTSDYIGVNLMYLQTGANFTVYLDGEVSGPYNSGVHLPTEVRPALMFEREGLDPNVEHNIQVMMVTGDRNWVGIPGVSLPSIAFDSFTLKKGATFVDPTASGGTDTGSGGTTTNSTASGSSNTGSPPTSTNTTDISSAIPNQDNTDETNSPTGPSTGPATTSTSKAPTPVIVGASLGGIAGFLLIFAFIMLYRRRKRNLYEGDEIEKLGDMPTTSTGSDRPSHSVPSTPRRVNPFSGAAGVHPNADAANGDEHTVVANQLDSSGLSPSSSNTDQRHASHQATVHMSEKQRFRQQQQTQHRPAPSVDSTTHSSADQRAPIPAEDLHASLPSSAAPMTSSSTLPVNNDVLRELAGLRAEVRRLTELQASRSDASSVITDATPAIPPPLYGQ